MRALKIVVGVGLLLLALAYLYRPGLIIRLNDLCRQHLFNDARILFQRKRIGAYLLVFALIALFMGIVNAP